MTHIIEAFLLSEYSTLRVPNIRLQRELMSELRILRRLSEYEKKFSENDANAITLLLAPVIIA
jgi:hypothetical protein